MNAFTCWWKSIKLQNKAIKVSEKGKKKYIHRWMMILELCNLVRKEWFYFSYYENICFIYADFQGLRI